MNIAVRIDSDEAIREANETPLELLNPGRADRFQKDTILPVFARLRREDPVHFTAESDFGPYWSVTRWKDIMAVDTNHEIFSSAQGITLPNLVALAEQQRVLGELARPRTGGGAGFITMDEPEHGAQRKAVSPTVAPANLQRMAPIVRERAGLILEHECSRPEYPVYVPCRTLIQTDYRRELRTLFGLAYDALPLLHQQILSVVYRHGQYSTRTAVSAKATSQDLWARQGRPNDILQFDRFYRAVRTAFNKLERLGLIRKSEGSPGYVLHPDGGQGVLKFAVPPPGN